uniref:ATP synthase complex subunit 8 n=1 Tax=Notostomus gibbosus TaxID=727943 RepID=A0A8A6KUJ8_9EUCA|nr:ATP synthase F0 subunit 8 [Notostomus gibbosus]QTI83231.1 ATP synthase F0 subunit 8 [Notostomus gibbosus]
MPQMAPLLWLNLFFFFALVFVLLMTSNYFITIPAKMESSVLPHSPLKLNWKW